MQDFMEVYQEHSLDIEKFLVETIYNIGDLPHIEQNYESLFDFFPSLELIYVADSNTYNQTSANIYRNKISEKPMGRNREYLVTKVKDLSNVSITKPYLSSATGEVCVSAIKKEGDKIIFMDFNLFSLLKRLGLIEVERGFNIVSKSFYFITATCMIMLSLFIVGYASYSFVFDILMNKELHIDSIFKPIISLTLGLAVFDLAKTVLEQEVFFKNYSKSSKTEYKVLIKFITTIIIALLIEALMVVFKIAIDDYSKMHNALYLITGVGIIIVSLSIFIYYTKRKK
jgi:hypothetical protein